MQRQSKVLRKVTVALLILGTLLLIHNELSKKTNMKKYLPKAQGSQMVVKDEAKTINSNPESKSSPSADCPRYNNVTKRRQLIVTVEDQGQFGKHVWQYLSMVAAARMNDLYPAPPLSIYNALKPIFELDFPPLEQVSSRCGLPWVSREKIMDLPYTGSSREMYRAIESHGDGSGILKLYVVTYTEAIVVQWTQLPKFLRLRAHLRERAQAVLRDVTKVMQERWFKQLGSSVSPADIQYVSVHARRGNYTAHALLLNKRARPVSPSFLQHAMRWMEEKLEPSKIIFLVTSDDLQWCRKNILNNSRPDVFLVEGGDRDLDLAVMGACNHSIFAYGTFALTGAMLAQPRYLVMYDIGNRFHEKEMELINRLPGAYGMDEAGKLVPSNKRFKIKDFQ